MLLKPLALIAVKTEATTGGLFQLPSVGMASSVFPKFHPGFKASKRAWAVIGVKVEPAQAAAEVPVAVALVMTDVELFEIVESVVGVADASVELIVPGIHWE